MATIKHPSGSGSVTPQTEGGDHPRGTQAKNYDHKQKVAYEQGQKPEEEGESVQYGAGKHFRDAKAGPSDLDRNPGVDSSGGTTDSGESGIQERDR